MKKIIVLITSIMLYSCGSNTTIVNSWRDPEVSVPSESFKKVVVVALVKDEASRRITENQIASIDPNNFHVSYPFLNKSTESLTKEQKLTILKDENVDAIISMRLVSKEKETNYVPGTNTTMYYGSMYGPYGGMYGGMYGNMFGGWYGSYSANFYDPGYYQESTYYLVETNVFSLTKNKLIWTGTTKSVDVTDLSSTVSNIITEVMAQMKKDGFIAPTKK